jgi:hypothetical protein
VALSTASQLPERWLHPSNNEAAHSAREEQRNFFAQPKAHQYKFAEMIKTVPMESLWLITFFKQCQAANKAAGILQKIKEKKQPKKKMTAHLPIASSHELSYQQHCCKNRNYHLNNQCNHHNQ